MEAFAQFLPLILISIPFAIGNYFLAKRIDKNPLVFLILSVIPFVNFFFYPYVLYTVVFRILDKLEAV